MKSRLINTFIAFMTMFIASNSNAGCTDIASLITGYIYIDISDGGCSDNEVVLSYGSKSMSDDWFKNIKHVPFNSECTLKGEGNSQILKCKSNGVSPLAGATYKTTYFGASGNACDEKGTLGKKFICVEGCTTAPDYLVGSDGSC